MATIASILADATTHAAARHDALVQWLKLAALGALVLAVVVGLIVALRLLRRPRTVCVSCGARCRRGDSAPLSTNGVTGRVCPSCAAEIARRVTARGVDRIVPRA